MSEKTNIQYNICPQCDGNGKINGIPCSKCKGRGVELIIDGEKFYWAQDMSPLHIYQRHAHRFLNRFLDFILLILSLIGFLCLGYYIFLVKDAGLVMERILLMDLFSHSPFQGSYLLAGFWIGVLIFMYLIYRMDLELTEGTKVKKNFSYVEELKRKKIEKHVKELRGDSGEISKAFTANAIQAAERAYNFARSRQKDDDKNLEINPLDLIISLLFFEKIRIVFFRLGISFEKLKEEISRNMEQLEKNCNKGAYFFQRVLVDAYYEAYNAKQEKVDVEEILLSLIKNDSLYSSKAKGGIINEMMYELEIDVTKITNVIEWLRINEKIRKNWKAYRHKAAFKPKGELDKAMTAVATPVLDQFSQDLTILAKYGYLSPCIGREKELAAFFRLFESGAKGVILVGNPGVGKNTLVEGIAQLMVAEDVPESWQDKRLVSLSISRLVSGANSQEAMERLLRAVTEAARSRNIILFIDSIEEMIGISAGRQGSLDLAEVLVSAMDKYRLIVVATTTPLHFTKYIEDSALVNSFQKLLIDEPDDNEAIQIMEAKTGYIEVKNNIFFSYGAIEKALLLTKRFIHDRFLPEKAINIIEETGVFTRKKKGKNEVALAEDVADLISQKVKMPLSRITEKESEKLINLEEKIHTRMVNQTEAVKAVADALRRARVEFRDLKRPIANLLFLGPTGVGKTELAKAVAEVYFGREDDMIRIDMSEYQAKDSIDRLIGAPNDYEVTGILTEEVRKRPFSLVLLDEIEKSHPDILNIFLQLMDDGRLTDNRGRVIDFTNVILIATSNAGTGFIQEEIKKGSALQEIKAALLNRELKNFFRPEFLNRFDNIIVFKPLSLENVKEIAKLNLRSSAKRMDEKGIKLEFGDNAVDWIARVGFDPIFGARPLRRAIQENIDALLAKYLISGKVSRGDRVIIDGEGEVKVEKIR